MDSEFSRAFDFLLFYKHNYINDLEIKCGKNKLFNSLLPPQHQVI